jgi:hypothetical protein
MKSKLLGLLALVPMLGLSPANASSYTYDVSFAIGTDTVTGTIVTNCDVCNLSPTDIASWSFVLDNLYFLSSTDASTVTVSFASPLTATPTVIDFIPANTNSSLNFTDNTTRNGLDFTTFSDQNSQITFIASPAEFFTLSIPTTTTSFLIAQVATTPLPATIWLLVGGIGGLGFLAYRGTKRTAAITTAP